MPLLLTQGIEGAPGHLGVVNMAAGQALVPQVKRGRQGSKHSRQAAF